MFIAGMAWLNRRARLAREAGEGYGDHSLMEPKSQDDSKLPNLAVAFAPIILVIGLNLLFTFVWLRTWDTDYLAEAKFGAVSFAQVRGTWSMILALIPACLLLIFLHFRNIAATNESLTKGAMSALLPTFNTGSEVGYGAVIASLAAFELVKAGVIDIAPNSPLIAEAISVNLLAGITGSASGGLSIALQTLGDTFVAQGQAAGIDMSIMHRIAVLACGGLDSLPHNGAVITLLTICGLTHRQSYKDIAVVTVLIPLTITAIAVITTSLLLT